MPAKKSKPALLEMKLQKATAVAKAAGEHVRDLRRQLQDSGLCTHSVVVPFEWEHDNGYGRQTKLVGLRCELCLTRDHWPHHKADGTLSFNPATMMTEQEWLNNGD